MRTQKVASGAETTFVLVFEKGDDPVTELGEFARDEQVGAAQFTGVGAFSDLVVGYFDRGRKEYRRIPIPEQVEVLSLAGDIALDEDGEPQVHAHVVVGKADGSAHGGHLLEAHVWPTLEVVLVSLRRSCASGSTPRRGLR